MGVNQLINSDNTINGNNVETLKRKLTGDANEEAARITENGMKYKGGKMAKEEQEEASGEKKESIPYMVSGGKKK